MIQSVDKILIFYSLSSKPVRLISMVKVNMMDRSKEENGIEQKDVYPRLINTQLYNKVQTALSERKQDND
jgi:hypothetical protein